MKALIKNNMLKRAYIQHLSNGKWRVVSHTGKNLGTYSTRPKAKKRLNQVEMFKHMKQDKSNVSDKDTTLTLSKIVRDINKNTPSDVKKTLLSFKNSFNNALISQVSDPEKVALFDIIQNTNSYAKANNNHIVKFAQSILEIGNSQLAGKAISSIIKFLIGKFPESERNSSLSIIKHRILDLNEHEMSSKNIPTSAALGQSIAFIKNILSGYNPNYIRDVIKNTVDNI